MKTLQSEAGRFTSLLNDLLDVSRIKSGGLSIRKEECNLGQMIHRVVDELRTIYTTHSLIIEEVENTHLKIACDGDRIAQVLTNLISNAVKYSPQANRVVVRLEKQPDVAVVSVQDFGMGIAREEQQKIFDMFYRAKNEGRIQGTGLGLFIAAQIIAAHDGRLWVTSELGKGSTFHFSIPVLKDNSL